jgi:hypothetical protein
VLFFLFCYILLLINNYLYNSKKRFVMIETKYNILGDNVSTFAENDLFYGAENDFVLGASGTTTGSTSGSSAGSPCNLVTVCDSYTVSSCTFDCVTDGICSNNLAPCSALLNPPQNCPSVFGTNELATEGKLYKNFGVGTNSSSLCTTKSRVISLGLTVNGTYSDNQLVRGSDVKLPAATSVSVSLDIILDNTSVRINGATYNITSQGGWLVPNLYASLPKATTYLSTLGNSNVFGIQCLGSNYVHVTGDGTGGWGAFNSSNHSLTNSTKTMGSLVGTKTFGTYSRTISAGNALELTFNLRLKVNTTGNQMDTAYYVKGGTGETGSIRATGFNINVTPYGVEFASTQQTNSTGYIEKTSWSISNGVGTFKGKLHITSLEF